MIDFDGSVFVSKGLITVTTSGSPNMGSLSPRTSLKISQADAGPLVFQQVFFGIFKACVDQ